MQISLTLRSQCVQSIETSYQQSTLPEQVDDASRAARLNVSWRRLQASIGCVNMIAIVAKLNVAAGKETEFEEVMLGLAKQVRANEAGNHLYTLVKDDDGYAVLELYDDDAALQAHGQSQHFRDAGVKFRGLMAGPPTLSRYEVVG